MARDRSRMHLRVIDGTRADRERRPGGDDQAAQAAQEVCQEVKAVATEARGQLSLGGIEHLDLLFRRLDALLARESDILSEGAGPHPERYPTDAKQRLLL